MEATTQQRIETFEFRKEIEIAASIEDAFEALLEEVGPGAQTPDGTKMSMKLDPWPGGRWYRDLGNNSGHLWGIVQSIKPPTLLELYGQFMMSYAASNHAQYRLKADGEGTRLTFVHTATVLLLPAHRDGMPEGWGYWLDRIRTTAERKRS